MTIRYFYGLFLGHINYYYTYYVRRFIFFNAMKNKKNNLFAVGS